MVSAWRLLPIRVGGGAGEGQVAGSWAGFPVAQEVDSVGAGGARGPYVYYTDNSQAWTVPVRVPRAEDSGARG